MIRTSIPPADRSRHALILCDGEPPSFARFQRHHASAAVFIALDGGGNVAKGFGRRPDYVIGDLDSYDRSAWPDLEPLFDPDQETNDLEKGLELALSLGMTSAVVLGATGRRIDHTLKNLSVFKAYHDRIDLRLEDEFAEAWLVTDAIVLYGAPGQVVSLFPLSGRVASVTTRGLRYPLNGEPLENGVRDGSSNELLGNEAGVVVSGGDLLVFLLHVKC